MALSIDTSNNGHHHLFGSPTNRGGIVEKLITKLDSFDDDDIESNVIVGNTNESSSAKKSQTSLLLGTVSGCYLPCLQNILGVILFLRLPYITSQAGVLATTAIIFICVASTFLTTLSLSSIASNGKIEAGGPYFVLSRNLGPAFGVSVGFIFYLGTTIASSMYVLGAVEAIQSGFALDNMFDFDTQILSLLIMFFVALIVSVGIKYVNMSAFLFLLIVLLSVFALLLGVVLFATGAFDGSLSQDKDKEFFDNMHSSFSLDPDTNRIPSFFSLLALFYPSVTGIMAGCNRSGSLKTPSKSIARGTLSAVFTTTFIYLLVVWSYGTIISNETLKEDKLVVANITFPHPIIVKVGIVISSIGAAMQCMAGAPNLLIAIGADGFIPSLNRLDGHVQSNVAIWCTWFVASLPTIAGNLDFITPIITIFFLSMYASVNFACFLQSILKSPGFRPTFKFHHWSVSFLGFVWCLGLAIIISWTMTLLTMLIFVVLYSYIHSKDSVNEFGDVRYGLLHSATSNILYAAQDQKFEAVHPKNWRPHVLTYVEVDGEGRVMNCNLLDLAISLKKGNTVCMVVAITKVSISDHNWLEFSILAKRRILEYFLRLKTRCFVKVVNGGVFKPFCNSLLLTTMTSGLAEFSPNTVLLPWYDASNQQISAADFVSVIKGIVGLGKALILHKGSFTPPYATNVGISSEVVIDIWWVIYDGGLLLLLPYILSRNKVWKNAKLRLFAVVTDRYFESADTITKTIEAHLLSLRISATVSVVAMGPTSETAFHSCDCESSPDNKCASPSRLNKILFSPSKQKLKELVEIQNNSIEIIFTQSPEKTSFEKLPERHNGEQFFIKAELLNKKMRQASSKSNLVLINLPLLTLTMDPEKYIDCTNKLIQNMDNILLVRGSGNEVVTQMG